MCSTVCRADEFYRRIFWLKYPEKRLDPFEHFTLLDRSVQRTFQKAFEYWEKGIPNSKRHHGWHEDPFRGCYVFKDNPHRLYGFLYRSPDGEQYNICVLCTYAKKKQNLTDTAILDRINRYRSDQEVLDAIEKLKKEGEYR